VNESSCLFCYLYGDSRQLNGCFWHRAFADNAMKSVSLAKNNTISNAIWRSGASRRPEEHDTMDILSFSADSAAVKKIGATRRSRSWHGNISPRKQPLTEP
jgi:hypothetical protein